MALRRPDVLCPQRVWNDSQGYAFLYLLHNVGDDGVAVADGGQRLDLDWVEAQLTVNGGHHTGKVYRQGVGQPLAEGGGGQPAELRNCWPIATFIVSSQIAACCLVGSSPRSSSHIASA